MELDLLIADVSHIMLKGGGEAKGRTVGGVAVPAVEGRIRVLHPAPAQLLTGLPPLPALAGHAVRVLPRLRSLPVGVRHRQTCKQGEHGFGFAWHRCDQQCCQWGWGTGRPHSASKVSMVPLFDAWQKCDQQFCRLRLQRTSFTCAC